MSQAANPHMETVSTVELRSTLEGALSRYFGFGRRIARLERRPSAYCTSFPIEELGVWLDDGTTLALMFKDLSWRALPAEVRRAKPDFLYDPLREIGTYGVILAPDQWGTATCYGAVVDHEIERYWLFLEKVPGLELYQVGEFAIWQQVAHWLAGLHTHFVGEAERLAQAVRLLRYDGGFYWLWLRRAQAFLHEAKASSTTGAASSIAWLATRYERVVERLVALPVTFIHGEFYASNVLVQETMGGLRVCPVDWEMAAVGPGLLDLAALTAGKWTEEQKKALALAYYAALPSTGIGLPTVEAFLTALDYCHLHIAMQWLGWSPGWSPPAENAQNWLGEALRLAEKLGL